MSASRKSNLKLSACENQAPGLESSLDPSLDMRAPDSPSKDEWVKCSKCKKWRIVSARDVKVQSLPRNWECEAMTWLPGLNSCEVPELTTTTAGYELLGVPVENINFDLLELNVNLSDPAVAKPPAASASAGPRPVPLTNRIPKGKCYTQDLEPRLGGQCKSRMNEQKIAAVKTGIRIKLKLRTRDLGLYRPASPETGSQRVSWQSKLKTKFKAGEEKSAVILKDWTVGPSGNHVLAGRRSRTEASAAMEESALRHKDITDEPGCSESGSLRASSQSAVKTKFKAHRGENSSTWKDQYKTECAELTESGPAAITKERVLEAVTIGDTAEELRLEALTIAGPSTQQEAPTIEVPSKQRMREAPTIKDLPKGQMQGAPDTEVPMMKWMQPEDASTIDVPTIGGRQDALSIEDPKNKTTRKFVKVLRKGANADFARGKDPPQVPMEERTSEVPTAQSTKLGVNREIHINDTSKKEKDNFWVMNAKMEAAALIKGAGDCRKSMPHMDDERPIADLYLQAGLKYLQIARRQEVAFTGSQESTDLSYAVHYMTGAETFDECIKIYENMADHGKAALCHILSGAARMRLLTIIMQTSAADVTTLSHAEGSLGPGPKRPVSLPLSLHSTFERFLETSTNISPMIDSWMKARACLASAEAFGGGSKYMKILLEVRKVCEMAMFDDFETLISQVYVAIDAFNSHVG